MRVRRINTHGIIGISFVQRGCNQYLREVECFSSQQLI